MDSDILKENKLNKVRLLLEELDKDNQSKEKLWQLIEAWRKKTKTTIAEVQSVIPLTKDQLKEVEKHLSLLLHKTILVKNVISKDLIGGVKIVVGSKVIDNSLALQLAQLKDNLKNIN